MYERLVCPLMHATDVDGILVLSRPSILQYCQKLEPSSEFGMFALQITSQQSPKETSSECANKQAGVRAQSSSRNTSAQDRLQLPSWETALWRGNEHAQQSPMVAPRLSKEALRMQQRALNHEHQQATDPVNFEKGKPLDREVYKIGQRVLQAAELLADVQSMLDNPMHKSLTTAALANVEDLLSRLNGHMRCKT